MDLMDYKQKAREAALRAGPGLLKVFAIYAGVLALLNLLGYFLETPMYEWMIRMREYISAGNAELPMPSAQVRQGMALSMLLSLLGRLVTAGWVALTLDASRGGEYSWHDLWGSFRQFWKVIVITVVSAVCCTAASWFFIFPGVFLFYSWRLSLHVLAEHPDYGPIRCMRQSRRLMTGERMNLFRLDMSCILLYGLAALLYYFSSGIIVLWRMPTIALLHAVFYNRVVYWHSPEETPG
jgi:uncharacterized membrane protein